MQEKLANLSGRLRRQTEERREEGKRGSKGFTLIELMVVLLIIGILMAIAIPTYLSERNSAQNTGAQTTVRNALTALDADYASQNAYVVPPGNTGTLAAFMETSEPSLTWVQAQSVSAINSVSIAALDSTNSGSGSGSDQAVEVVSWSPTGKCWEALQVQMGSSPWTPGTYYNVISASSGSCTASDTMPATTSGWGADWAQAGQTTTPTT